MMRSRGRWAALIAAGALVGAPSALAAGGGGGGGGAAGGGGGGGGGGAGGTCTPLRVQPQVAQRRGFFGLFLPTTVTNCSGAPISWNLSVTINTGQPWTFTTSGAVQRAGDSITVNALPLSGMVNGAVNTITAVVTETSPVARVIATQTVTQFVPVNVPTV